MKKIIISAVFILVMCVFASAQTPRAVFDKVKEIRLLESNRKDVEKILKDFKMDATDEEDFTQEFSKDDWDIEITYSSGNCYRERDDEDLATFMVSEWKVTRIEIDTPVEIKIEDLEYDRSGFIKEQKYENYPDWFVYHNKDLGIAFEVVDDEIDDIFLFPSKGYSSMVCESNEVAKTFYSSESWFRNAKLEDRVLQHETPPANVEELILSAAEITAIAGNVMKILVSTVARDPENDVLTYNYKVSGGEIVGQGAEVVWDLSGLEPGTYTITAGVDDGCGLCGVTKTQTVVVKKAPDHAPK